VWKNIADREDRIREKEAAMAMRRTTIEAIRRYAETVKAVLLSWEV
jgi:hypothetical protein